MQLLCKRITHTQTLYSPIYAWWQVLTNHKGDPKFSGQPYEYIYIYEAFAHCKSCSTAHNVVSKQPQPTALHHNIHMITHIEAPWVHSIWNHEPLLNVFRQFLHSVDPLQSLHIACNALPNGNTHGCIVHLATCTLQHIITKRLMTSLQAHVWAFWAHWAHCWWFCLCCLAFVGIPPTTSLTQHMPACWQESHYQSQQQARSCQQKQLYVHQGQLPPRQSVLCCW